MGVKQFINETEQFARSADNVWEIVGDTAGVADWLPAVEKCWMEGDVRVLELAGGSGQAKERITEVNSNERYYTYEMVEGPAAGKSFTGRFAVVKVDGGAQIDWTAVFVAGSAEEGAALKAAVAGMYRGGLDNLRAKLAESGN